MVLGPLVRGPCGSPGQRGIPLESTATVLHWPGGHAEHINEQYPSSISYVHWSFGGMRGEPGERGLGWGPCAGDSLPLILSFLMHRTEVMEGPGLLPGSG